MPNYNCDCEDTQPGLTLEQYQTKMLNRLGFAAVAANPPPGMAELLATFLQDAQEHLYLEYPALRTRRFFRWSLVEGERFYGILDNDENWTDVDVTLTIASPCVVTVPGGAPPNGRLIAFHPDEDGALPTGLTAYTRYYVINSVGNTCNVSLTSGGAAINTTGTQSGTIHARYSPASTCVFNMEPTKEIEGVWIVLPNPIWLPMSAGIPPEWYTTVLQPGIPSRYEIRQCIEVFPAPATNDYELWVKGHFGLQPFAAPADKPTIDGELVYLHALARAKAHYGQPDAAIVATDARRRCGNLVASLHTTQRYVPGTKVLPPAVMPIFLPLNGAPP